MGRQEVSKFFIDFVWVLRGQLYSMRSQWFWYVVYLTFSPLTFLFFLSIYGGTKSPDSQLYVITGAIANAAVLAAVTSLGQTIGYLREQNALEYYASLPISKLAFIMAVATRGVFFSLPSSVLTLLLGSIGVGLPLHFNPFMVFLVYVISAYSLTSVGAVVGFYSQTPEAVGLATQIIAPLIVMFAPVYVPASQLPPFLQVISKVIPTTYVAQSLRLAIKGELSPQFWQDLLVVCGFTVIGLFLAVLKADWRIASSG
ncbi:MAG TPA: ABC transporter permease [Bacillota bacterium]|jgi:ABC-2 type transport system permease protein